MTDKPPAYENQWPAGYGMQSDQPAGGWTTGAPPPPQQGNPPPQFQQPQPQFQQQQQYQPKGTQQVIRKLYISTIIIFYLSAHHTFSQIPIPNCDFFTNQAPFMNFIMICLKECKVLEFVVRFGEELRRCC